MWGGYGGYRGFGRPYGGYGGYGRGFGPGWMWTQTSKDEPEAEGEEIADKTELPDGEEGEDEEDYAEDSSGDSEESGESSDDEDEDI